MSNETALSDGQHVAKSVKPVKNAGMKTVLLSLLIVVLLLASAGGSYWWRDKTAKKVEKQQASDISSLLQTNSSLKKQLAAEKAKNTKTASGAGQTACASKSPGTTTISNIEASITSGNTAALAGYMATSVNVVYVGAMGSGAQTPGQAVTSITSFISPDTSSWNYDFALPASVLSTYGKSSSYGQYFPSNAVVGKASNNQVISFSFDCNGKISTVLLAASATELQ